MLKRLDILGNIIRREGLMRKRKKKIKTLKKMSKKLLEHIAKR